MKELNSHGKFSLVSTEGVWVGSSPKSQASSQRGHSDSISYKNKLPHYLEKGSQTNYPSED